MKAEEYFDRYGNFGNSVVNLYKQEIVDMLKHYAEDAGKSEEEIDKIKEPKKELTMLATGILVL